MKRCFVPGGCGGFFSAVVVVVGFVGIVDGGGGGLWVFFSRDVGGFCSPFWGLI